MTFWVTIVYFPVAHWVFDFGGRDRSGRATPAGSPTRASRTSPVVPRSTSTPVPPASPWPSSSASASAGPRRRCKPHNLPLVLLGAGLLWFGWFGFNAGSALAANQTAALAFINTQVATAAGVLGWLVVEKLRDGHPTTPRCRLRCGRRSRRHHPGLCVLAPWAAILLGVLAGALCALAVGLKYRFGFDDSLDVVGVHLVGGIVGCLFLGFFGTTTSGYSTRRRAASTAADWTLLGNQALSAFSVLAYSFIARSDHRLRSSTRRSASGSTEEDEVERHRPRRARRDGVRPQRLRRRFGRRLASSAPSVSTGEKVDA